MGAYRDSQLGLCIDISGPDGNAFALMGHARNYLKQLGRDKAGAGGIDEIIGEMMDGDYENLLDVFERYLGNVITLIGRDQ